MRADLRKGLALLAVVERDRVRGETEIGAEQAAQFAAPRHEAAAMAFETEFTGALALVIGERLPVAVELRVVCIEIPTPDVDVLCGGRRERGNGH